MKPEIPERKFRLEIHNVGGEREFIDSDIKHWGDIRQFVVDMIDNNANDVLQVIIKDDLGNWENWGLVHRGGNWYAACTDTIGG